MAHRFIMCATVPFFIFAISCSKPSPPPPPASPPTATPTIATSSSTPTASPVPAAVSLEPLPAPRLLSPEQYKLHIEAKRLDGDEIQVNITTNIPGTIEVMAAVSLAGQRPNDPYVGKDERVRIIDSVGSKVFSLADLPRGAYDAEVDFYPTWGFQDSVSRSTGITSKLHATTRIGRIGSGEPAGAAVARKKGQAWVAENLYAGVPWRKAELVKRFGPSEELVVDRRFNPDIIKAYYFSRIDTTIFANVLLGEVSHWRFGRASS